MIIPVLSFPLYNNHAIYRLRRFSLVKHNMMSHQNEQNMKENDIPLLYCRK